MTAPKPLPRHVITASRLEDGAVTYLGPDRTWVPDLASALLFEAPTDRDAALAWAKSDEARVCNAYAFDALLQPDGTLVLSARERFRRDGAAAARARLGY
ncbi:MAG: hypothetical protein OHK0013_33730 [Sandaracinaceae bacterium]